MPTNTSAETATVISTFPFTETVDPGDAGGGSANELWYRIAPVSSARAMGAYAWTDTTISGNQYRPDFVVYSGDDPDSIALVLSAAGDLAPRCWDAEADTTYWIELFDTNAWDAGDQVTLTVDEGPAGVTIPVGSAFIPGDIAHTIGSVLSCADGSIISTMGEPPRGESGAVLDDGTMLVEKNSTTLQLRDSQLTVLGELASPTSASHVRITHDGTRFYVAGISPNVPSNTLNIELFSVSSAGVHEDTWNFTVGDGSDWTCQAIAATRVGGLLHIALDDETSQAQQIATFDLNANAITTDFLSGPFTAGYAFQQFLFVLESGDLLLGLLEFGIANGLSEVRRYSDDGSLAMTYTMPISLDRIHPGVTDATFVAWLQHVETVGGLTNMNSYFYTYRVSDGTLLVATDAIQTFPGCIGWKGSLLVPTYPEEPGLFGPPDSCPLLITRGASEEDISENETICLHGSADTTIQMRGSYQRALTCGHGSYIRTITLRGEA